MHPDELETVLDALAVFRLTRLVTEDTFPPIRAARDWVWRRWPPVGQYLKDTDGWKVVDQEHAARWSRFLGVDHRTVVTVTAHGTQAVVTDAHPLGELAGCPWCASPYLAAAVLAARTWAPRWWAPVARILALSAVTGLLASH